MHFSASQAALSGVKDRSTEITGNAMNIIMHFVNIGRTDENVCLFIHDKHCFRTVCRLCPVRLTRTNQLFNPTYAHTVWGNDVTNLQRVIIIILGREQL